MPGSAGGWFDYMDPQAHEPASADPGIGKAERRPSDVGLPDGRAFSYCSRKGAGDLEVSGFEYRPGHSPLDRVQTPFAGGGLNDRPSGVRLHSRRLAHAA
jgi:hypothetical protein